MRVRVLRILDEPHCTWAHDGAAPGEYHGEGIPLRGVSFLLGYECRMRYVHEHRARYPVVEGGPQWREQQESSSRTEGPVGEHPYRADIQHHPASQREDNQLDDDERGDLCSHHESSQSG